jgi:Flp pilus assembly protein TadD
MLNRTLLRLALLTTLVLPGLLAVAAPPEAQRPTAGAPAPEDPDYAAGRRAVEAKDWQAAMDAFNKVVAKNPGKADAHNFLAYSYRKSGNLDMAFKHYHEALRLDPNNRSAHEYIGEAYLMANNLAKAEEHLQALDRLCFLACEQYTDLKKAVAEYKQKTANK